ncbi:hypothetical protein P389DRAFT_192118 [Cystobasidium minutum MCA 4210]|uniref:uncharacterized protein n=1 Tax=Cystobasidium minutum MCA 4210 TaxID=1397322 RepID=UPI0034CFF5A3|eukprot:jgi/Rhomi1/192118/gm1.332_g
MGDSDKLIGAGLLLISTAAWIYYTIWSLIVVPLLPEDSPFHRTAFPNKLWAIRLPISLLIVGLALAGFSLGIAFIKSSYTQKRIHCKLPAPRPASRS